MLNKDNKLKLPEVQRPDEVWRTNDPNYCFFHRMMHHPVGKRFVLKDNIQYWCSELKLEQKKVIANTVTLNFGTFPKVTVPDGFALVPTARLEFINLLAEKQKAKGLVSLATKSEEIMWVHPDIVKDEQWESS